MKTVVRNYVAVTLLILIALSISACAGGNSNKEGEKVQIAEPVVSNEPNKKMVEALIKHEFYYVIDNYENLCKTEGTFLATAYAQNCIDYLMMHGRNVSSICKEMRETYGLNTKTLEDLKSLRGIFYDIINDYLDYVDSLKTGYTQDFTNAIRGKESAQEVSMALDELINTQNNLSTKDKKKYTKSVDAFKKSQPVELRNTVQGWTDLIAFKVYKIDEIVYKKGISKIKSLKSSEYYNEDFMNDAIETSIGY